MPMEAERAQLVRTECERVKQYLAALPAEAWTAPSACALWEVRDVVAHLIVASSVYIDSISRGLQDDYSTLEGRPDPSAFRHFRLDQRHLMTTAFGQRALALRQDQGEDLVARFGDAWDHFRELLAQVGSQDWDKPCYHPWGLMSVRAVMNTSIFELAIHGWDIYSVREPSVHLSSEALPVVMAHLADCQHWFFTPDEKLAEPLRYRFALTGALSGQWDIEVEGDRAHMAPSTTTIPANTTFGCDGETFALMMCGRLGLDAAIGDGRITPTGDLAGVETFKHWFRGAGGGDPATGTRRPTSEMTAPS